MKRTIALLLSLLMIIGLTACGGGSGKIKEPSSVIADGVTNVNEIGNENTGDVVQNKSVAEDITIEETVLVDESGVKVTAKSLSVDEIFGPSVKLLIENNSGKDLTFQCRDASVNGYMIGTMMSVDVVNGKKANDNLTFMSSDLESCGVETIADIEFSLHIFTSDSWDDFIDTPQIQLRTSAFDSYEYVFDNIGDLAYNENGVEIVVKGISVEDSIFGPGIIVYIANSSERDITVQVRDVSVNGFMMDTIFSSDVLAGKHSVSAITFLSSDLEENEITEIEETELSFHIFDKNSWDTIVDTNTVTITF